MKLTITNGKGEKLYIDVDNRCNLNDMQGVISRRMRMDFEDFCKTKKLFFHGSLLVDGKQPLQEYGISNGGNILLLDKKSSKEKSKELHLDPKIEEEIELRTKKFGSKVIPPSPSSPDQKVSLNSMGSKLMDLFQALVSSQISEEEEQMNEQNDQQPQAQPPIVQPGNQPQQPQNAEGNEQQQQQQQQQQGENKLPEVNPEALAQLQEMGFSEQRAKKALLLTSDPEAALNWLFQHEEDPNADDPLTEEEIQMIMQKNSLQVNDQALQQLLEMGFQREECIQALQLTNNNYERACSWLLGDREIPSVAPVDSNIVQLLLSPMIQSMQSNPQIAQSLQDPRTLLALQDVINNPRKISQYVNDPVIAPVLLEAVRFLRRLG